MGLCDSAYGSKMVCHLECKQVKVGRYVMQTRQMRQTAIVHEKSHETGESEAKTRGELVIQILFSAASPVLRIASSTTTSFNEDKMLNSSISRVPAH